MTNTLETIVAVFLFVFGLLLLAVVEADAGAWVVLFLLAAVYWRARRARARTEEVFELLERTVTSLEREAENVRTLTKRIYATEEELKRVRTAVTALTDAVEMTPVPATPPAALEPPKAAVPPPVTPKPAEAPVRSSEAPVVRPPAAPAPPPVAKPVAYPPPAVPVAKPAPPPPVETPAARPPAPQPPRVEPTKLVPAPLLSPAPAASAAVREPTTVPMRAPAAATPELSLERPASLEERLGANWLNKLGVVILVFGVAFFLIWQFGGSPGGKVFLGFLGSLGTLGAGIWLERRERYQTFARSCIGGGWAMTFFTTFAMHHVEAARVLQSQMADLVLMLAVAAAMVTHTLRYRSQVVTGLALLLGFSTVTLSHSTVYSLTAGAVLAAALVAIVRRMGWFELEVFGILASYLNHFFWLQPIVQKLGTPRPPFAEFWPSVLLLCFYWAIFRFSYVARRVETALTENISTVAALLNTGLLLALMKYQSVRPELAFWFLLGLGAVELGVAQLPPTRRRRAAFVVLTIVGATLLVAAFPFRYSGSNLALLWLAEAEAFLLAGVFLREVVFRRAGLVAAMLTAGQLLAVNATQVFNLRVMEGGRAVPDFRLGAVFAAAVLVFYANAHGVARRWADLFEDDVDQAGLVASSYLAAVLALVGAWIVWPDAWTAVAWAALVAALAFAGLWLDSPALRVQAGALGAAALLRALVTNLELEATRGRFSLRLITVGTVAALFYLASWWLGQANTRRSRGLRAAFTSAAALLVAVLAAVEMPRAWVAVHWLGFAILLGWMAARLTRSDFAWQANALGVAGFIYTLATMDGLLALYPPLTENLIAVSLVPALLYVAARWSRVPEMEESRHLASLHTSTATLVAALIAVSELPSAWTAVFWAGYALALAVVGRMLKRQDLPLQAQVLALVTFLRILIVNVQVESTVRGLSLRLVTLALTAAIFYLLSRWAEVKDLAWTRHAPAVSTWLGSTVVWLLLFYELRPVSVAVGWMLLGLLLFELGMMRGAASLRWQGHVALASSFVRLLAVNLNAVAPPGELSPRVYTIVPLALAYYYVYHRLTGEAGAALSPERPTRAAHFHAWFGTIALAALAYVELNLDWVIAAWAAFAAALLGLAVVTGRRVFQSQGLLLAYAVVFRGAFYNLYPSTAVGGTAHWAPRSVAVAAAVALLALAVPFAFRLRGSAAKTEERAWLAAAVGFYRPEQPLFFIAVAMLTTLLAIEFTSGIITVAWGLEAVAVFCLALWAGERSYRLTGLSLLLLCVGKIVVLDVWQMGGRERALTFVVLGLALLAVSFLYNRYRETLRRLL